MIYGAVHWCVVESALKPKMMINRQSVGEELRVVSYLTLKLRPLYDWQKLNHRTLSVVFCRQNSTSEVLNGWKVSETSSPSPLRCQIREGLCPTTFRGQLFWRSRPLHTTIVQLCRGEPGVELRLSPFFMSDTAFPTLFMWTAKLWMPFWRDD